MGLSSINVLLIMPYLYLLEGVGLIAISIEKYKTVKIKTFSIIYKKKRNTSFYPSFRKLKVILLKFLKLLI